MRIPSLLIFIFSLFPSLLFANNLRDSIGVENVDGKQVIVHKVETKETYYSLGRKYGVPVKTILNYNDSKSLHPGTVVKIPTERPFETNRPQSAMDAKTSTEGSSFMLYKVEKKETLYAIAKKFDTNIEDIKQLNNLKGNALTIGQTLKIRATDSPPQVTQPVTSPPIQRTTTAPSNTPEKSHTVIALPDSSTAETEIKLKQNKFGIRQQEDHGIGVWIDDENIDATKQLALHNVLPKGTIIKVTNPMNGKSTLVKVLGGFTEKESTKDVIIVITKAVADLIGVIDKRFQVNISYGVPNEN